MSSINKRAAGHYPAALSTSPAMGQLRLTPILPIQARNRGKVFAIASNDGEPGENGACFIRVGQDLERGKSLDKFRKKAAFSAERLAL